MVLCSSRNAYCSLANLFLQQNWAQLERDPQLEVMPNFRAAWYLPCARKNNINLLAQKLLVKWWWNWRQGTFSLWTKNVGEIDPRSSKVHSPISIFWHLCLEIEKLWWKRNFCFRPENLNAPELCNGALQSYRLSFSFQSLSSTLVIVNAQGHTVFYYMRKSLVYLSSHDSFKLIWMLTRKCSINYMTDASCITIG